MVLEVSGIDLQYLRCWWSIPETSNTGDLQFRNIQQANSEQASNSETSEQANSETFCCRTAWNATPLPENGKASALAKGRRGRRGLREMRAVLKISRHALIRQDLESYVMHSSMKVCFLNCLRAHREGDPNFIFKTLFLFQKVVVLSSE